MMRLWYSSTARWGSVLRMNDFGASGQVTEGGGGTSLNVRALRRTEIFSLVFVRT